MAGSGISLSLSMPMRTGMALKPIPAKVCVMSFIEIPSLLLSLSPRRNAGV